MTVKRTRKRKRIGGEELDDNVGWIYSVRFEGHHIPKDIKGSFRGRSWGVLPSG